MQFQNMTLTSSTLQLTVRNSSVTGSRGISQIFLQYVCTSSIKSWPTLWKAFSFIHEKRTCWSVCSKCVAILIKLTFQDCHLSIISLHKLCTDDWLSLFRDYTARMLLTFLSPQFFCQLVKTKKSMGKPQCQCEMSLTLQSCILMQSM